MKRNSVSTTISVHTEKHLVAHHEEKFRKETADILHTEVQGSLLSIWQSLGHLTKLIGQDDASAKLLACRLRDVVDEVRDNQIKRASTVIFPIMLNIGLIPAIRILATSMEPNLITEVKIERNLEKLDSPVNNVIPFFTRIAIYRFVQEALGNILTHSGEKKAILNLEATDGSQLTVDIKDKGYGCDPTKIQPGVGMALMSDRIQAAGGSWTFTSSKGVGSTVNCVVPLKTPS